MASSVDIPRFSLSLKTIFLSIFVGVIAGMGSVLFLTLLQISTKFLLGLAGYSPPVPFGETKELLSMEIDLRLSRYIIIILPAFGGLISGVVTYKYAPEAEGDGTDATIDAFHNKRGYIKPSIPPLKAVTSAVLIGSGGSAGREGPISHIGAGAASVIATKLRLSDREREIMIVAGMAAGIGSIFRAPLGGSIFGIETLYRRDYEVDALVPAVLSTFVAYIVFSLFLGWEPIFKVPEYSFTPPQLLFYAMLGILAGLLARVYVRVYTNTHRLFERVQCPRYIKPAIGGLLVGIVGFFLPQVLETGYGWIQYVILGKSEMLKSSMTQGVGVIEILIIILFMKMIVTSLTVGSGGSGGLFAPSLVIGGFLGGVVGFLLNEVAPGYAGELGAYILVGMGCFFAAAAKVPIASIVMVAEMTWDYNILAPAFLASIVAYFVSGDETIYEKQIDIRMHSPLHEREFVAEFLSSLIVENIAVPDIHVANEKLSLIELERVFSDTKRMALPVVDDEGNYLGIVTVGQLMYIPPSKWEKMRVRDIIQCKFVYVYPKDSVLIALYKMLKNELPELPVVDKKTGKLIGEISFRDIIKILHYKAEEYFEELRTKYKVK